MLLVKTAVKFSKISGVGLFTLEDIPKGKNVWIYNPETELLIKKEQFQILEKSANHIELVRFFVTYGIYVQDLDGILVDLDDGRFINHSLEPNLGTSNNEEKDAWKFSVALRDIQKGEELTENYETYETSEWSLRLVQKYRIFDGSSKI